MTWISCIVQQLPKFGPGVPSDGSTIKQNACFRHTQISKRNIFVTRSWGTNKVWRCISSFHVSNKAHESWLVQVYWNNEPKRIYFELYMRAVLNSFIWKTSSSPKIFLSPNFSELHVFLSRYMLAKICKKNVDVWYPQIVPGVWPLVTLPSAAAALKHLLGWQSTGFEKS